MRPVLLALSLLLALVVPAVAQPVVIDVRFASVGQDGQTGQPSLKISLSRDGQRAFSAFTADHVGQMIDVLVDGAVVTSPVIRSPIESDWILVTGPFTASELEALAETINRNSDAVALRPAKIKSGS